MEVVRTAGAGGSASTCGSASGASSRDHALGGLLPSGSTPPARPAAAVAALGGEGAGQSQPGTATSRSFTIWASGRILGDHSEKLAANVVAEVESVREIVTAEP